MIKVVWLLIVTHYSSNCDCIMWTETHHLETHDLCIYYSVKDVQELMSVGVPVARISYACIQVVVPDEGSK